MDSTGEEFWKDVAALFSQYRFERREQEPDGQQAVPLGDLQRKGGRLAKASEEMIAALSEFGAAREYFLLQMYSQELVEAIGRRESESLNRESLLQDGACSR